MPNRATQFAIRGFLLVLVTGTALGQLSDLRVSMVMTPETAYANEQVLLRREVDANGAAFGITGTGTPAIAIADVLQLSQTKQSANTRQQIHTQWAVFAREPGEVTIAPQEFQATLPATGGSNPIAKASSNSIKLQILPAPESPPGVVWLPAQALSIKQHWVDATELVIGEPKALAITITASGQRAAAIPPLLPPASAGLRWYTSPPTLTNRLTDKGVTGIRTEHFTVVAQSNDLTDIPAFSITWFDTIARTWRQTHSNSLKQGLTNGAVNAKTHTRNLKISLLAGLAIFAILAVGWVVFNRYRQPTESTTWRRVKHALHRAEPAQLVQAVSDWSVQRWPSEKPMRLEQLAALLKTPEQKQALLALNAVTYGKTGSGNRDYNKESLTLALKALRNHGLNNGLDQPSLTPLYPAGVRH